MGLMDTLCVCAGGEGRWASPRRMWWWWRVAGGDHCGRGEGEESQGGREAGEAADIHEAAKCFSFFSRRGDTLLVCREAEGEGKREGEGDE